METLMTFQALVRRYGEAFHNVDAGAARTGVFNAKGAQSTCMALPWAVEDINSGGGHKENAQGQKRIGYNS